MILNVACGPYYWDVLLRNKKILNFKVSYLLIIFLYSHKNVFKFINQCTKVAVIHPPYRNEWGVIKLDTWYNHSYKYVVEAEYHKFVFEKVSLQDVS